MSGEARIIFLFLRDLRYPLGAATVIDALRGSESERVLRHRLERADGYGRLRSVSAARLRAIFNHLTAAGYLEQAAGQYPTLSLGAPALEFLEYGGTVTLRVARGGTPRPREHGGIARGYGAVRAPEGTAFEIRKARGRACVRYFHRRDAARHERPKAAHDG